MAWQLAVMAVAAIGNALISNSASRRSRRAQEEAAAFNAMQARLVGESNANAIMAAGALNAQMSLASGALAAQGAMHTSLLNAQMQSILGDYNARLIEADERLIWEALDLDITQMEKAFAQEQGRRRVAYGASGVILDQDSPFAAQIDAATESEMEKFVIKRNADLQSKRLLDAAARSRWEGNMAASQLVMEGRMSSVGTISQARLSAAGSMAQAGINAMATRYNVGADAAGITQGAAATSASMRSQEQSNLATGIFNGVSNAVTSYYNNKVPEVPTTIGSQNYTLPPSAYPGEGTIPMRNVSPYSPSSIYQQQIFRS